jgi:hypothetical protein
VQRGCITTDCANSISTVTKNDRYVHQAVSFRRGVHKPQNRWQSVILLQLRGTLCTADSYACTHTFETIRIVKRSDRQMKVKVLPLVLSHMVVAVCYNEIMTIFSSFFLYQYSSSNADGASFVPPGGAQQKRRRDDSSFSACLLVMDENFRLQEWIAYAYVTLPLRYLVVTVDPKSKLSPTEKLDIFRSELNMTIVEWAGACVVTAVVTTKLRRCF